MPNQNLTGKVAFVTGAASGMGRMSAKRLAAKGMIIAAVDRDKEGLDSLKAENQNINTYSCDISDYEDVKSVVSQVTKTLGPIYRLMHAAAIMPLGKINDLPVETIVKIMRINYEGTVYILKSVMPGMLQRNVGEIICFGSIAGEAPLPEAGAYCASKAATNAYVRQTFLENQHTQLNMLLVCPPPVNTPLLDPKKTGSTTLDLEKAKKKGLVVEPEFILDQIEMGLEKGTRELYPGWLAKGSVIFNRLFPNLYWKQMQEM